MTLIVFIRVCADSIPQPLFTYSSWESVQTELKIDWQQSPRVFFFNFTLNDFFFGSLNSLIFFWGLRWFKTTQYILEIPCMLISMIQSGEEKLFWMRTIRVDSGNFKITISRNLMQAREWSTKKYRKNPLFLTLFFRNLGHANVDIARRTYVFV